MESKTISIFGNEYRLTSLNAFIIVFLIWTGIYLPGLGVMEVNRNEFRRIDPAITMIETGNWKTPVLEGKEYFKKPPLINWLIGASFVISGERSEFTARLPSALFVLFFVSFLVLCPSGWLSIEARLASSLLYMTTAGILSKGLISEIESSYISLAGMSIICWLNLWSLNSSKWLLWTLPSLFLGFGLLLKGPIVLFFYYLTVICVLLSFKQMKKFFSLQHLAGFLIMTLIFLSWAYSSYKSSSTGNEMTGTWIKEILLQLEPGRVEHEKWASRVFGSIANVAPWLVFLPFFFKAKNLLADENKYAIFKGCIISILIGFVLVNLMPGTKARYSMPMIPLLTVLTGLVVLRLEDNDRIKKIWRMTLNAVLVIFIFASISGLGLVLAAKSAVLPEFHSMSISMALAGASQISIFSMLCALVFAILLYLRKNLVTKDIMQLLVLSSIAVVFCMLFYMTLQPVVRQFEGIRPIGRVVNSSIPQGEAIHLYKIGCEPFLFYIKNPMKNISPEDLRTGNFKYIMLQQELHEELSKLVKIRIISTFKQKKTIYEVACPEGD